jgi:hypothetical protein
MVTMPAVKYILSFGNSAGTFYFCAISEGMNHTGNRVDGNLRKLSMLTKQGPLKQLDLQSSDLTVPMKTSIHTCVKSDVIFKIDKQQQAETLSFSNEPALAQLCHKFKLRLKRQNRPGHIFRTENVYSAEFICSARNQIIVPQTYNYICINGK